MRPHVLLLGPVAGMALLMAGCNAEPDTDPAPAPTQTADSRTAGANDVSDEEADTDRAVTAAQKAGTPMEERVATLGLLNKRNNVSVDIELKPGESRRQGDVIVRLAACERTAPWEMPQETGGFVQVLVQDKASSDWRRVFSGWLFAKSPSLNVVEHPIYDVWIKDCAMRFPGEEASPGEPEAEATSDTNEA